MRIICRSCLLDSGKHYTQAGHAMGDGDMLARLADTHHRVVIPRGTDKTSVCGEELTTTRGSGEGPDPRRIAIGASRA